MSGDPIQAIEIEREHRVWIWLLFNDNSAELWDDDYQRTFTTVNTHDTTLLNEIINIYELGYAEGLLWGEISTQGNIRKALGL